MKLKQQTIKNNTTYIGSFSVLELKEKYHTPLYIYDEEQINDNIYKYIQHFKDKDIKTNIVYASKAFICPYLIKLIQEKDMYIDSISLNDLLLLKKVNFDFNKIILHGNNKSVEELEYAINNQVGLIVCDNYNELIQINNICSKLNKSCNIMIRINPGIEAHTHAFIQTSLLTSKFGESMFDEVHLDKIFTFIKNSPKINLKGFHAHIGSMITSSKSYQVLVSKLVEFSANINNKYNFLIDEINYGGGFGIKYLDNDETIDLEETLKTIINETITNSKKFNLKLKSIYIEPGRSIVGDACATLYTVSNIKTTQTGLKYVFVDGGMADNIRPSLYDASYSFENVTNISNDSIDTFTIAGKCCESGDVLGNNIKLQTPKENDLILCYSTGAYCYSMSMNYNMLSRPGVIFINKDKINVGIRKETFDDLIKTYVFERSN